MTATKLKLPAPAPKPEALINGEREAFARPLVVLPSGEFDDGARGLTKREEFASRAMQGICADGIPGSHHVPAQTAKDAVAYADALLAELAKEPAP